MRFAKAKGRKIIIILITVLAVSAAVVLVSTLLAKYLVEKYDIGYLGREVTVDWVYVNPFTGFVHLHGLEVKELNNDTIFFSANSASAKFAMFKMFFGVYEVTALNIDKPVGFIIQKNKNLNFNDIIERFRPRGSYGSPVQMPTLWVTNIDC